MLSAFFFFQSDNEKVKLKYESVKKRSFNLMLRQRGLLEASRFVQIKSSILSNTAKIVELVNEGTKVSKGMIIARFDIKLFMDEMNKWQYKIGEANAAHIKAKKEVEIHKNKSLESLAKLKKSIEIQEINLEDVRFGGGLVTLNEYKQKISQEERKVKLATEELIDFEALFEKGYISKRERDVVENKLKNSQEAFLTAKEKLVNYKKYDWPKQLKEHEIKLQELKEALVNKDIQNTFMLDDKKAQLLKTKSVLVYYESELQKAKKNVQSCDIRAPIDGIILYNIIPKNGKKNKVDIGDSIWQNQSFMQIPDTQNMIVRTKVREIDLNKISKDVKVNVTLDAYADKVFSGKFDYIDVVAKNNNEIKDIKFFDAIIKIDKSEKILRSGMSASIDIVYDKVENSLSVPNDAINYDSKSEYVEIYLNGSKEKSYIEIGKIGSKYSEVTSGLQVNEQIILR